MDLLVIVCQKIVSYSIYCPNNHQLLHLLRIIHYCQIVKKRKARHKLLQVLVISPLLSLKNKTLNLFHFDYSSSIHPIKESFQLFKSLWASLFQKVLFSEDIFDTPTGVPSLSLLYLENYGGAS